MKKQNTKSMEELILENEKLKEENSLLEKRLKEKEEHIKDVIRRYDKEANQINVERFIRLNVHYIRNHGLLNYLGKFFRSIGRIIVLFFKKIGRKFLWFKYYHQMREIIKAHPNKKIMLFYPGYDFHMQMYQRPQHMATNFAKKDILFFYCTPNINDKIYGFEKIQDNLYVTNQFTLLKKHLPHYTLYMCANMNGCYLKELNYIKDKGNDVLYEYIDDLHEDLTDISQDLLIRHKRVLEDESIPIVVTAQHLYNKALKYRKNNIILSTNGVIYDDFHITKKLEVPENIKNIVKEKKPIIGYYGALAKWFDYDLIAKLATERPDINILLIGIDYDKSMAEYNYFKDYNNIYYIGPVNYKTLVNYGYYCNVLTIPFVINEITLSTSPVKVFEYMSMEKPIVTTALPECKKYESVLISNDHDEFIKNIDKALKMQDDKKYKALLKKEALENTWDKKVEEILNFIDNNKES